MSANGDHNKLGSSRLRAEDTKIAVTTVTEDGVSEDCRNSPPITPRLISHSEHTKQRDLSGSAELYWSNLPDSQKECLQNEQPLQPRFATDGYSCPKYQFSLSGNTLTIIKPAVSPTVHSTKLGQINNNATPGCSKDHKKDYTFQMDVVSPIKKSKILSLPRTKSPQTSDLVSSLKRGADIQSDSGNFKTGDNPLADTVSVSTKKRRRICRNFDTRLSPVKTMMQSSLQLYSLPLELLDHILSFLSFAEICRLRVVSKKFDEACCGLLNKTFSRLQLKLQQDSQRIKAQMPRRESARRKHPLVRECDIIETLHMRVTLLQMTFGKHIERKHICFFPGEILDEVFRILRYVKSTVNPARAYKVTDELFDLSTMAMEYFKERLEPQLPAINYFTLDYSDLSVPMTTPNTKTGLWKFQTSPSSSSTASPDSNHDNSTPRRSSLGTTISRQRLSKLQRQLRSMVGVVMTMKRELKSCKNKMAHLQKQQIESNSRLEQHERRSEEQSKKINELSHQLRTYKSGLLATTAVTMAIGPNTGMDDGVE